MLTTNIFTLAAIVGLASAQTKVFFGNIEIGDQGQVEVAWVDGVDPCTTRSSLAVNGDGLCDGIFFLGSDTNFQLQGCGGPLWLNRNNQYLYNCHDDNSFTKTVFCPTDGNNPKHSFYQIHPVWSCEAWVVHGLFLNSGYKRWRSLMGDSAGLDVWFICLSLMKYKYIMGRERRA
jgi:hypothetical protein